MSQNLYNITGIELEAAPEPMFYKPVHAKAKQATMLHEADTLDELHPDGNGHRINQPEMRAIGVDSVECSVKLSAVRLFAYQQL
jgi:hypothetical protein